jgi:hypothetical protein
VTPRRIVEAIAAAAAAGKPDALAERAMEAAVS